MSLARKIAWYARRLSVMGPREILHRLAEQATLLRFRFAYARQSSSGRTHGFRPGSFEFCSSNTGVLPDLPWNSYKDRTQVQRLLDGKWHALGCDWRWTEAPEVWHRAPDTGKLWPRCFFARIPHRTGNPYGDIRIAWEPSRLQHLVDLAMLSKIEDTRQAKDARALLESAFLSWIGQNPPLEGIHYISAMECGLRILSVCHALDLARERLVRADEVWSGLLGLVDSHAGLIERRLSLNSSAGNHTIAECAGLIYAGVLFPEMPGAARWQELGEKYMTAEAERQILPDGGGLEQAFWYLLFVVELCGLVIRLLESKQQSPPERLVRAFARGRTFLRHMADDAEGLPDVGDRDDGRALSGNLGLVFDGNPGQRAPMITFPDAGYTLMRSQSPQRIEVLFDHGPLGMPPLFGHGHSDALSIVVRRDGRDLLIDPGTFSYTGDTARRRYFRSTAAHNTIAVDQQDQAVQENAFMWSSPYRCKLVRSADDSGIFRALGTHEGYRRLGNIVHWRGVALSPSALIVWDRLDGQGEHAMRIHWHCALPAERRDEHWQLGSGVAFCVLGADTMRCQAGEPGSAVGWRSMQYGRADPIWTIIAARTGHGPCEFVTWLAPDGSEPSQDEIEALTGEFRSWMQASQSA